MVFLRRKKVGRSTYLYVVSNKRVDGRIVQTSAYVGKEEQLPFILQNSVLAKELTERVLENLLYQTPVSLWGLMEEMGLRRIFSKYFSKKYGVNAAIAACVMVLNYAVDRRTKNTLKDWFAETFLPHLLNVPASKLNKDLLCRTMDFFSEEKIEEIHADVYKLVKEKFGLSDNLLLYDVTSITFEGSACSLAKRGYNPDRVFAPQINLAMPVTLECFPASHKVFEGNTRDCRTLEKSIELVEKAGVLRKTIFVFDRGVCSNVNFGLIEAKGAEFICGFTKNARVKSMIAALAPQDFARINDDVSFHEVGDGGRRLIFFSSEKLREEQSAFRVERLKKISERLVGLAKTASRYNRMRLHEKIGVICGSYRKFFDVRTESSFSFSIKQNFLDKTIAVEGKYAILTNTLLEPSEVLARYRDRNFIEMSFKDLKLFVDIRPVRHWRDERVLAHVFLAVLAFGLRSLLQLKLRRAGLRLTAEQAISELNKVRALVVNGKVLRLTGESEESKRIVGVVAKNS